jgi:hypothetical protein
MNFRRVWCATRAPGDCCCNATSRRSSTGSYRCSFSNRSKSQRRQQLKQRVQARSHNTGLPPSDLHLRLAAPLGQLRLTQPSTHPRLRNRSVADRGIRSRERERIGLIYLSACIHIFVFIGG